MVCVIGFVPSAFLLAVIVGAFCGFMLFGGEIIEETKKMEDIKKKAYEAYPKEGGKAYHSEFGTIEFDRNAELREGYIKCAEEYESLPKIHGWVARHKNGELCLFSNKPEYKLNIGWVDEHQHWRVIDYKLLPEVTYKDSPIEVELLIRKVESTKQV